MSPETPMQRIEDLEEENAELRAKVEAREGWRGLMAHLDEHYPADLFDGSGESPGAKLIPTIRLVDRWKRVAMLCWKMADWFARNEAGTPVPEWCFQAWPLDLEELDRQIKEYEEDTGLKVDEMKSYEEEMAEKESQ